MFQGGKHQLFKAQCGIFGIEGVDAEPRFGHVGRRAKCANHLADAIKAPDHSLMLNFDFEAGSGLEPRGAYFPVSWNVWVVKNTLQGLIFLIAAPASGDNVHLEILGSLARKIMHEEFRDRLRAETNPAQIAEIVTKEVQK